MRWYLLVVFLVLLLYGDSARADWKITTAVRSQTAPVNSSSISTQYFKGGLRRTDWLDQSGRGRDSLVTAIDYPRLREIIWDTKLREYAVIRLKRDAPAMPQPGRPLVVIERATVDTGEARQFFGRAARHLITNEKRHAPSNTNVPGPVESETKIDGWYIDAKALPGEVRGSMASLLTSGTRLPRLELRQSGPAPRGLAVLRTDTSMDLLANGDRKTRASSLEVTELNDGTLPSDVFTPPAGFRRVVEFPSNFPLSWADRMQRQWEMLEDYLSGGY